MTKFSSFIKNKLADWVSDDKSDEGQEDKKDGRKNVKKKKKEIQPKVIKISLPSFKKKTNVNSAENKQYVEQHEDEKDVQASKIKAANNRQSVKEKSKFNISLEDLKTISTALDYFKKYLLKKGQKAKAIEVDDIDKRLYDFIIAQEKKKER